MFLKIEEKCVRKMILDILELEKKREPFLVYSIEKNEKKNFFGLTVRYRIDRIDKLSGNEFMVLDYKTGANIVNKLKYEKGQMINMQLPFYVIAEDDKRLGGAAYIGISFKKYLFSGIFKKERLFVKNNMNAVKTNQDKKEDLEEWRKKLCFWKNQIENISKKFLLGKFEPFSDGNLMCFRCNLKSLCRMSDDR